MANIEVRRRKYLLFDLAKTLTMNEIEILLVEDNEGDIILTREAFLDAKINNRISVARDGEEAIIYLNNTIDHLLPDLILLDINLPRIDGKELLKYIKNHSVFKNIPVVILTTSSSELDIKDAINLDANGFLSKPVDKEKLFEIIGLIDIFSITLVKRTQKTNEC